MMMKTKCPKCSQKVEFVDAQVGYSIHCPKCNREFKLQTTKSTLLRVLFLSWMVLLALTASGSVAYTMFPGMRRATQSVWRGVVGMFDVGRTARGR